MARLREIMLFSFIKQICIVLSIENYFVHNTSDNIMEKCILDILTPETYFGSIVAIINNEDISNDFLQKVHLLNNVNVIVKDSNVSLSVTPSINLIFAKDLIEFENVVDNLDRDWHRQPEALYIIIVKSISENVAAAFKILWEYHIIHVLLIVDEEYEDVSIYTYFPYAEGGCGREYKNTIKLSNCKNAKEWDVLEKLREYDQPVLDNCILNVGTRHYPPLVLCEPKPADKLTRGIERSLVDLLLETKNISLNYTCFSETEEVGNISDNFTVSGMMYKLYENEVDFIFGGLSMNHRRVRFFDFLCVHLAYEDMYVPATHTADLKDRWRVVYIIYQANVWMLLLIIMVLCAVLLSDFRKLRLDRNTNFTVSVFLNLIGNATQNVSLALSRKLFQNFLVIHWLWFIFLFTCFYQTRLTSFTTYRLRKPQIDQYYDLKDYSLTPCIPLDITLFLKNSGQVPIINEELNIKEQNCGTSDLALDEIANVKSKYTVTMYFQYLWWIKKHATDGERVYLMKESVYNNLYAVFFKRGFPFIDLFNAMMLRLPEHGFVHSSKHFHRLPRELGSNGGNTLPYLTKTPLKLEDLTVPFGLLATGLIFASIAFVIEITIIRTRIISIPEYMP